MKEKWKHPIGIIKSSKQLGLNQETENSETTFEEEYSPWWTRASIIDSLQSLPEDACWNYYICVMVLLGILLLGIDEWNVLTLTLNHFYNIVYAMHIITIGIKDYVDREINPLNFCKIVKYLVDIVSYLHYATKEEWSILACYYVRLHRPLWYLFFLNDHKPSSSILGTAARYCFLSLVLRMSWATVWLAVEQFMLHHSQKEKLKIAEYLVNANHPFLKSFYLVNKMFIPIGPTVPPAVDVERIACLLVMLSGCLVVTGFAIAALSSVISIYLSPEEAFRTRYRLIIQEMHKSNVPKSMRVKVETFYKMYWHKQRAVSAARLLSEFPPTLISAVYTDIYFEATQKSRILRNLSYPFLSEVSKKMATIHYTPSDLIIKRGATKSSIIYITYGDVEMLTPEDDSTAMVRLTRGSALSSCGGCAPAACRAYVAVRAASFCTAHALAAPDLWRVARAYGRYNADTTTILKDFRYHIGRVKRHYKAKIPVDAKYKSSILHFKRNLTALKESRDATGAQLLARTDYFLEIAHCYLMRNRTEASLRDEADAICLRPRFPCILQPNSSLQWAWSFFTAFVIVLVCFTHPYYLVFVKDVPVEFRVFDYAVTAIFVLDLIAYLSTGANVEEGIPITFTQTSSLQIRSHWFALDLLATLPIFEFIHNGHFAGINKILRFPKVLQVLMNVEEECVYHTIQIRLLSYTLMVIIACYLIAALQQGFVCFVSERCQVTNFTHMTHWTNDSVDNPKGNLHFSMYWAISMLTFTTHVNTMNTEDWDSYAFIILVLELCIVLHIFIQAVYSANIMVNGAFKEDYDDCITRMKNFLIKMDVEPLLRQRFITYLGLCWYTDKAYSMINEQKSIFHDLPPHVHQEIVARQRNKYLLSIPFMKLLRKEELNDITSKARVFSTSPNEVLLSTGDITNEVYVITQGICEILNPDTKEVVRTLGVKCEFGVLECLLRQPAFYTVRAITHVQLLSISRKHLLRILKVPQIKDAIDYAKEQHEYVRLQVARKPFVRYEPLPPTPNLSHFPLPRKHERDYDFLQPFMRLGFLSVLRYVFPRFTIRPDGPYLMRYERLHVACALALGWLAPGYTYLSLQFPSLYYIVCLLDFAAYFDVFQRTLVGYFNKDGILVYHPSSTAAHYLRGAFVVDLFACLPLEELEQCRREADGDMYRVTFTKQFLMLNRLVQLYRLPGAMLDLDRHLERQDILFLIKVFPFLVVLLNVLTCYLVFYSANIYASFDNSAWLITPLNDTGVRFNLTETPWNLHLACYFWIVYQACTTGYNSIYPSNLHVIRCLFSAMFIGAMVSTYFSVRVISIRSNVNKALAAYKEHLNDIISFMKREKLSSDLQREIVDHFEYNWHKMAGVDYRDLLKYCDQISLRTDAVLNLYGPIFTKCPVLAQCELSLLRVVGRAAHSVFLLRGAQVLDHGDVIPDLYFLAYGTLQLQRSAEHLYSIITLCTGSMFGNLVGTERARCDAALVALTNVHLLQINAQVFHSIVAEFPSVLDLMKSFCPNNENYIMGIQDLKTPVSFEQTTQHWWTRILDFQHLSLQYCLISVCLVCISADVYNAGFQNNSFGMILTLYLLDFAFYMKILMQLIRPHFHSDEEYKNIVYLSREKYRKHELKYDVASVLPLELLSFCKKKNPWLLFSVLRLNRILRIKTIYRCLLQQRLTSSLIFSIVVPITIWFALFIHCSTCLWYFIGTLEEKDEPKSSWFYDGKGSPWCESNYICSLYFVLTTFTQNGVGDIMPKKHSEVLFVSIYQVVSSMVYLVYVGEFSNIIQFRSFRLFRFYDKYLELQEFLENNRVSKNLVGLVNKYSLHFWRECRGKQLPRFLENAPHCLRLKVMSAAYLHHFTDHPVFKNCDSEFLQQLVGSLQLYTYCKDMDVVRKWEITNAMYIIHTGRVQVFEKDEEDADTRVYLAGQSFGILQGLVRDTPYRNTYRTLIKSQVLTLCLDDWEYLLDYFPKCKNTIENNNDARYNDSDDTLNKRRKVTITLEDDDQKPYADQIKVKQSYSDVDLPKNLSNELMELVSPESYVQGVVKLNSDKTVYPNALPDLSLEHTDSSLIQSLSQESELQNQIIDTVNTIPSRALLKNKSLQGSSEITHEKARELLGIAISSSGSEKDSKYIELKRMSSSNLPKRIISGEVLKTIEVFMPVAHTTKISDQIQSNNAPRAILENVAKLLGNFIDQTTTLLGSDEDSIPLRKNIEETPRRSKLKEKHVNRNNNISELAENSIGDIYNVDKNELIKEISDTARTMIKRKRKFIPVRYDDESDRPAFPAIQYKPDVNVAQILHDAKDNEMLDKNVDRLLVESPSKLNIFSDFESSSSTQSDKKQ